MTNQCDLIYSSLLEVSEVAGDIGPACLSRFYERSPGSKDLMIHMDEGQLGQMMDEVFRLLLLEHYEDSKDYLKWEVSNHAIAYSATVDMIDALIDAVIDVLQETLGEAWNDEMASAWLSKKQKLLGVITQEFEQLPDAG